MRFPALRAGWTIQTFPHWQFPADRVRRLLPPGLVVDEYEGAARVSLTPFVMAHVRAPGIPPGVPGLPTFAETNLRTYVRGPDGRDGLWFLSIEVACPLMLGARVVGAPCDLGRLRVSPGGGFVAYRGSRSGGAPSYRLVVRTGEPVVHFSPGVGHVRLGVPRPHAPRSTAPRP